MMSRQRKLTERLQAVALVLFLLTGSLQLIAHDTKENNCPIHLEACSCKKACQRRVWTEKKALEAGKPSCHQPVEERHFTTFQSKAKDSEPTEQSPVRISIRSECIDSNMLDFALSAGDQYMVLRTTKLSPSTSCAQVVSPYTVKTRFRALPVLLPPPHV